MTFFSKLCNGDISHPYVKCACQNHCNILFPSSVSKILYTNGIDIVWCDEWLFI